MRKYEKEVVQAQLNNEKAVLKKLEANYNDAFDEINDRIAILLGRDDADMSHVIYQVEYQKALKTQVQSILEKLQTNEFETVSEYLTHSYDEGFLGAMYELQAQGVPLVIPINEKQVVAAIQHETELSTNLYTALGKDIKDLNKKIAGEISRGISTGATYKEIARNVAGYANIPKNNAMRIARTEAHRIQETAASHAQEKAKARGADIVKIWDATLDSKTRTHHIKLDGQIKELDKPFEVAGLKAMRPGQFGRPEEDINCRCRSRADARWALTADETKILGDTSKMSQEQLEALADKLHLSTDELKKYSGQIIPVRASSYDDFKRQYDQLWQYEGSDLQKEAEKRIGGYAKQRVRSNAQKMNGIEGTNDIATKAIKDSYEYKRIEKGISRVPYEDLGVDTNIKADFTGMDERLADASAKQFAKLAKEYDTTCEKIVVEKFDPLLGSVPASTEIQMHLQLSKMAFNKNTVKDGEKFMERMQKAVERGQFPKMEEEMYDKYVVTHEFAHTLMDFDSPLKNYVGAETKHIASARKEIKEIYNKYMNTINTLNAEAKAAELKALNTFNETDWKVAQDLLKQVEQMRISKYADNSIDEFMAEAFTDAKIGSEPSEYSLKVATVIDKYFKKTPLENTGKSSTIKSDNRVPLDLQFFAKKTKHADQRLVERIVSDSAIDDALEHPLYKGDVVIDAKGRPSVKYIGIDATVIFNPDTKEVVTTWKTGSRTKKKYGKGD